MLRAFDEGRIFAATTGSPLPRVLALHGWARTHADFAEVLAGFDALAVDLPGSGASPPPDAVWGGRQYADAVARVVDEVAARDLVVLGHSFGGQVAVHLAVARPDLVRALVITGTPLLRRPKGSSRDLRYRMARWLHRRHLLSDDRMEALRRRHGSADYRAATGVMRDVYVRVVNERYDDELGLVTVPVELVWGEDDAAAPVEQAVEAAEMLRDARLQRLAGVGHFTPQAAPQALRDAIAKHLA